MSEKDYCPLCKYEAPFNTFTVMNDVDANLQVPSFLRRTGLSSHSLILHCPNCDRLHEVDSQIGLTDSEASECNRLWEQYDKNR